MLGAPGVNGQDNSVYKAPYFAHRPADRVCVQRGTRCDFRHNSFNRRAHMGECALSERALKSDERAGTQAVHTFTEEVCGFAVD